MKKILCVMIAVAFLLGLCACTSDPQWQPYNGTLEGYTYYHKTEREHDWEEDVLCLAQDFSDNYPLFQTGKSHMYHYAIQGLGTTIGYLYDEQLRTGFFGRINELIPKLAELTDTQIIFELQKIVASLDDVHSGLYSEITRSFPILFEAFFVGEEVEYRAVGLPVKNRNLMFAKLISINGIALGEIIRRLTPYVSVENEYGLISCITDGDGWLYNPILLAEVGILESATAAVDFVLQTDDGEQHTVSLSSVIVQQLANVQVESRSAYKTYSCSFQYWNEENFWYEIWPEEATAFVRINRFMEEENETIKQMFESLMASLRENEHVSKVIVDLRRNGGGNLFMEGYQRLLQALKLPQIEKVCVLIDQGTFSQSVVMGFEIQKEIETAVLIGTPAGEGSFFIGIEDDAPTLPNSGLTYRVATLPVDLNREEPFDALMPDLLVYPTLEDYKNGIDTVLEVAKNK